MLLCVFGGGLIGLGLYRGLPAFNGQQPSSFAGLKNLQQSKPNLRYSDDSYNEGIMKVAPSVVSIYSSETIYKSPEQIFDGNEEVPRISPRERRSTSQGSGVIIDSEGLVLTNWHLIDTADEINVVLSDGSLHKAIILGSDNETDLAVIRIEANELPAVEIAKDYGLRVGDIVLAIGNPFGVGQTITQGIVSATARRVAGASAWQNFVQIDAAINPGNSGGALINPDGELVGVNTAVFLRDNGAEGIGFAIPATLLTKVVPQLIENGHMIRGWLGIGADDLQMFPGINQQVDKGAVITGVLENSPAHIAGLRPYDVVVSAAEQPIVNATELLLLVSGLMPGTKLQLVILRGEQQIEIEAALVERPNFEQ